MNTQTELNSTEELLNFFKALADANRLKIVGLLAQKSYTVEQLANALGLGISTTSHHLAKLSEASLVSARADGHYYYYSLKTDILHEMSQRLLADETLANLSRSEKISFEDRVMATFVEPDGRIKAFPVQEKKFAVLLNYVLKAFEPGVRYTEKQVNEILQRFNEDTASLRRGMIEYHMMDRASDGGAYWRI
jgi:predicted transcriptional regulator